jgi:peptide/nickel transport system substrate-binding protein
LNKIIILLAALVICTTVLLSGCGEKSTTTTKTSAPATTSATSSAPASTTTTAKPPSSTAASTTAPATTSAPTTTAPATTATATTPAAGTPKKGGILKFASNFNLGNAGGWPADAMGPEGVSLQFCMESLVRGDAKGQIAPWLAESFKMSDDLKSCTLVLRKGVKFHDGTDFNAAAAKWNMENLIAAKKQPYWASIDIVDEFTIKLNFSQWTNGNLNTLDGTWMVSKAAFDKNGIDWMRNNPVGTGPFKFVSFQKDVSYKWTKNPNYWIKDRPYLDGVEITYVADPTAQKAALQSGQVDMLQLEPGKMASDLKTAGFDFKSDIIVVYCLLPDNGHANSPFANPKVMQAIDYAIDREAIAKAFSYGFWGPAYQIPAQSTAVYNPDFNLGKKLDIAKAKALLAEAGYPNGFKTTILHNTAIPRDYSVAVQAALAAINVTAEINFPATPGAFFEGSNSLNNVLVAQPIMAIPNYNTTLRLFLLGKDSLWDHNFLPSADYLKAYQTSLIAPAYNPLLVRVATDLLSKDSAIVPFAQAGMGWSVTKYVKDAGFLTRSSTDLFDSANTWLDK